MDYEEWVTVTCLMIIGLRTMFRGRELGGILFKNIVFVVKKEVRGIKVTVERTKTKRYVL